MTACLCASGPRPRIRESKGVGDEARIDRLCELNVVDQVEHVCQTTIVNDAWRRKQPLAVHGWIYDVRDGLLRDLRCTATGAIRQRSTQRRRGKRAAR